jgi:hypothetical protein
MSAINVLTFPTIFDFPQAFCGCVCSHPETHIPVIRTPIVSARWAVEINGDGTRRLVEHWSVNPQKDGQ